MFFWGVLGLAWVKLMLPWLLRLIQRIPWKIRYSLTAVCLALMLVDAAMTLMALDAWYSRMAGIEVFAHGGHRVGFAGDVVLQHVFQR